MNTIFVGGSRRVSRLSRDVKERLNNVIASGFRVIVGDANGADRAVQKYLSELHYRNVIVFCSGDTSRNNVGQWEIHTVAAPRRQGFDFYAAKDREMARQADFGLMIWDGESPGTMLNVLRLVLHGKKVVLYDAAAKKHATFKTPSDWSEFISRVSHDLRMNLIKRATADEKPLLGETDLVGPPNIVSNSSSHEDVTAEINAALAKGDPALVVDTLGSIARARGMGHIAKESGLARESLYRSLSIGGNPEFATVFKVLTSMGLRLLVSKMP